MWEPTLRSALVVDDDAMVRQACARVLQVRCKLEVFAAADLATGRRLAIEHRPDVSVVDLLLPDGYGYELIAEMCALKIGIRHLLMSSNNQTTTTVAAMQAGATNVLDKPLSAKELELYAIGQAPAQPVPHVLHSGDRVYWEHVHWMLRACGGNKSEAARLLGIDRNTLSKWLDRPRPAR